MPSPLGTALRRILSTGISFSVVVGFTVEPCDCSTLYHKLPAVCQYEVGMIDRCHFNITSYSDMVRSRRTGWRVSVLPPDDKIHAHTLHHVNYSENVTISPLLRKLASTRKSNWGVRFTVETSELQLFSFKCKQVWSN